jgi:hypothetical protein
VNLSSLDCATPVAPAGRASQAALRQRSSPTIEFRFVCRLRRFGCGLLTRCNGAHKGGERLVSRSGSPPWSRIIATARCAGRTCDGPVHRLGWGTRLSEPTTNRASS